MQRDGKENKSAARRKLNSYRTIGCIEGEKLPGLALTSLLSEWEGNNEETILN